MIRHRSGDEFLLITQDDHARFSGVLAGRFGNGGFAPPDPREAMVSAAGLHDSGWPLHDQQPTLNSRGEPMHVFETPAEISTRVWNESVRCAAETGGPYCGLLVSLHVLNLSLMAQRGELGNEMHADDALARFAVHKFQHTQVEQQEHFRKTLGMRLDLPLNGGLAKPGADPDEDRLRFNFACLRLCDAISLDACCSTQVFQTFEGVHPKPGAAPIKIEFGHPKPFALTLDPWPFADHEVKYEMPLRRIAVTRFESPEQFQAIYASAPAEVASIVISPRPG